MAEDLGLSWEKIHGMMDLAVSGGLELRKAEPLPRRGLDEKAFRNGQRYFTLVNDLERPRVRYVAEERTQAGLDGFWGTLTEEQLHSIGAVALDMWDSYGPSVRQHLPSQGARWSSTGFTSSNTWGKPWTRCGGRKQDPAGSRG